MKHPIAISYKNKNHQKETETRTIGSYEINFRKDFHGWLWWDIYDSHKPVHLLESICGKWLQKYWYFWEDTGLSWEDIDLAVKVTQKNQHDAF